MNNNSQLYHVTLTSPEFKTVGDYVADISSPAIKYVNQEDLFLSIADENGVTNKQRIINTYTTAEKKQYANSTAKKMLLKIGTKLVIPADNVDRSTLLTVGIEIVSNDDVAFKAEALVDIESDNGYQQIIDPIAGQTTNGVTQEIYPDITVWIWCRGLSNKEDYNQEDSSSFEMKGEIFDITPFISNLQTNVTKNGGNFQFTLPPLVCSLDSNGKWTIQKNSFKTYINPVNLSLSDQGYISEASLYDENMQRNLFLFSNIINTNDVVFIRFETLEMEKNIRYSDQGNLYVDKNNLPGKLYDMIGLVDIDGTALAPANNDVAITVNGRDLMKLFIEDGSYFYPTELSTGKLSFAGGSTQKNDLAQRVFSDNALQYFSSWFNNSLEKVFQFVIQQLSTIKIVPDDLFSAYGDRRNTKEDQGNTYKDKPVNGQLQTYYNNAINYITQLRVTQNLAVSDVNTEKGIVIGLFNNLKNFFQSLRTNNVRKVSNNHTIGWNAFSWVNPNGVNESIDEDTFPYYFVDKLFSLDNFNGYDINLSNADDNVDYYLDTFNSQPLYKLNASTSIASGIWQIIKLVIDSGVTNRRIVDSSISSASGSLLNYFRKVCQEPFIEFFGDTYGDIYALTVRKPPIDQVGLISLLEGKVNTENGKAQGIPVVIDVEEKDVIREDLYFDDNDVYSWYHLQPRYNTLGDNSSFNYFYLPALFFQEYADIWGSRPMDLSNNYMPYYPQDPSENTHIDLSIKQGAYDLKFMVESNQYNPFVRKGTIIVNRDRRIKVGNIIRYKATGEIFFIDGVQHNYKINKDSIDATTTIMVSRGMVEQLIYGIPVTGNVDQSKEYISYFNIIDTTLNFKYTDTGKLVQKTVPRGTNLIPPDNTTTNLTVNPQNINTNLLDKYDPSQRQKFIGLINAINANGYTVIISPGGTVRTYAEQVVAYQHDGRNAKPGHSSHEFGEAIDINIKNITTGVYYKKATPSAEWQATGIPALAQSMGFKWGGNSFGNYYDPVHFQISKNSSNTTTEQLYTTETTTETDSYLDESAIFSNFKVNRHVFNFFLRKEQNLKDFNTGSVNRTIYNPDVSDALGRTVVVTASKK